MDYFTLLAEEIHLDFYAEQCNTNTRRHLNSTRKTPLFSLSQTLNRVYFLLGLTEDSAINVLKQKNTLH